VINESSSSSSGSDDCIVAKMSSNGVFLAIWGATERLEVGEDGASLG